MIRAALKSLFGRKVRLLMSTFAIVLGVAFVAGTLIFSDTLNRSFTALFASTVGDVVVRPDGGTTVGGAPSTVTLPSALVEELAEIPGAARADGNVEAFGVYVVGENGKVTGGLGPPALGGNWTDAPVANDLTGISILKGEVPQGPDEVVIDEATVEKAGYQVGDKVTLLTAATQGKVEPTLVGIAGFEEGGSLNGASLTLFDTKTAQDLFLGGERAFNSIWVTADDGVSQPELRDAVAERLPKEVKAVTGDKEADDTASELLEAIEFLTTFLLIFAGISLVVGAFLIVNTFSILVAQRSRELALLRALGASSRQVTGSVLLEAFVLGVVGATLGLGLGVLLAMGIRALFGNFGLDLSGQSLVFTPATFVAAYVVGVGVTMAAAWLPARRTSRIAPVQAMRDDIALPDGTIHRRFLLGLAMIAVGIALLALGLFSSLPYGGYQTGGGILLILLGVAAVSPVISRPLLRVARVTYARVFGSIGNLAGQNSLRNPRRTAATASALMIGLTLACTMAIIGASAKASVDKSVEENFVGDFVVSNVLGGPFSPSIAEQMSEVEGVEEVIRQRLAVAEVDEEGNQGFAATDPATIEGLELKMRTGDVDALANDTVIIADSWAEDEGYRVGDTVKIKTPAGNAGWRIVGTFEDNPVIFYPILTTLDTMTKSGYPAQDNFLIIQAADHSAATQQSLEDVVAGQPIVTVKNEGEFADEQREPIDQFVLIIYALLGLALVIAVLGIVNTLALSVIERTREVGLLRAIGVSRAQLRRMITLESVVIAVLGTILGVVLGLCFGIALMYAVRDEGLEVISVPLGQLAIFLGLSVLIGMLAAIFPARRAARLDVLRAIATE